MPADRNTSRHLGRLRGFRGPTDDEWDDLEAVADALGTTRSKLLTQWVRWMTHRPSTRAPQRPSRQHPNPSTAEDQP